MGWQSVPIGTTPPRPAATTRATDGTGQRGHVWPKAVLVDITGRWVETRHGILLEWRRGERGRWEALVIEASGGGMTPWSVVMRWVDEAHVRPIH